ncbi:MAG: hypothetical protein ACRERC_15365, partial [Candidatus Binatia bacterium]
MDILLGPHGRAVCGLADGSNVNSNFCVSTRAQRDRCAECRPAVVIVGASGLNALVTTAALAELPVLPREAWSARVWT